MHIWIVFEKYPYLDNGAIILYNPVASTSNHTILRV